MARWEPIVGGVAAVAVVGAAVKSCLSGETGELDGAAEDVDWQYRDRIRGAGTKGYSATVVVGKHTYPLDVIKYSTGGWSWFIQPNYRGPIYGVGQKSYSTAEEAKRAAERMLNELIC